MDRQTKKTFDTAYSAIWASYEEYLVKERGNSSATIKTKKALVNAYTHRVQEGDLPLRAATITGLTPQVSSHHIGEYSKGVQPTSVAQAISVLDEFFTFLERQGTVAVNPIFRPADLIVTWHAPGALSDDEVEAIFHLLPVHDIAWVEARDRAILHLYYDAELDPSQLFSLTASAFDGERLRVRGGRDRSLATLKLPRVAAEALSNYLLLWPGSFLPDDPLFRHHRYHRGVNQKGHARFLQMKAEHLQLRYTARLLRMAGVKRRMAERPKQGRTRTPPKWQRGADKDWDFEALILAFRQTHPRWD
ncbi:Phage integrase, N-terminal SAM-like domain [Devosia crocina]|uniref:Phage integrase, N-terminal SAM-like domain n=1 Tax=Devosia crocina TaxID=429728 RepID=A0A1I7NB13_9HYPH|nr:site-specific integrase [Devosia crocina]SFV31821.1 Phage integrase, N-terminal SAM-like domain [Devosia crocina]